MNDIRIIRYLFLLIISFYCIRAYSQKIHFERISTSDGLSNNHINDILQDKSGFLWIATDDGLNRYDGYEFKVFRNIVGDKNSLADNSIWSLAIDKDGKIWAGSKTGWLSCYDPVYEKFSNWYIASDLSKENTITTIFIDDEKIWLGTYRSGLYLFDPNTGEIKNWKSDPFDSSTISYNYVSSIVKDKNGNLWIGCYSGLNRFKPSESENFFQRFYKNKNNYNSLSDNLIWNLTLDQQSNILWIGTSNGLTALNLNSNQFTRYEIPNPDNLQFGTGAGNVIREFYKNEKIIWVDSYAGLLRINLTTGKVDRFLNEKNNQFSLPGNRINKIYRDNSGVIWIGTDNGLAKFSHKMTKFNYSVSEKFNYLNSDLLYDVSLTALAKTTDGTIWFGTEKGLFYSEPKEKKRQIKKFNQLGDINIWSLSADSKNNLWIGTYGEGIYQINSRNKKLTDWDFVDKRILSISRMFNKSIFADAEDKIWIGYWGLGLAKLDPEKKTLKTWLHNNNDSTSLSFDDVWVIMQDNKKKFWFGTNGGGINIFNEDDSSFIHITADEYSPARLSGNSIYSVCESRFSTRDKTIIWVGTANGLNKLIIDETNPHFQKSISVITYNVTNGLPDNSIKSIIEDFSGNLWIGTSSGISCLNIATEKFTNFNISDGLISNDINLSAALILDDGWILMGSKSGLNYFDPEEIKSSEFKPPVLITDFRIFNKSLSVLNNTTLSKSILFTNEIAILYSDNVFSIHFTALDFNSPQSIKYSYMLEGFDRDWIISSESRLVTYTNLNPGRYVFRLKSTNSDGIWNDEVKTLTIIISPPWWQTYWAVALYILIFVLGVWGIIKFQVNREKLHNELKRQEFEAHHLREVEKMKSRFFANLSHEFRTPLLLIKGPLEQLISGSVKDNLTEYYQLIKRNADRLQTLIDQLLELSKLETESIPVNKQLNNLIPVIRNCIQNFYSLAKQKNINFSFNSYFGSIVFSFDRDKMEKIINNLLSNAVKYTPIDGEISVDVDLNDIDCPAILKISVKDSGPGIPEEHIQKIFDRFYQIDDDGKRTNGFGIGLALVKELVTIQNWEINVESRINEGSKFTISVLLSKEDLKTIYDSGEDELTEAESSINNFSENRDGEFSEEKPTILFIDDSEDVRIYVGSLLKEKFNLYVCSNAKDGIEIALKNSPDLIISDVMMPEMDGTELCRKVKSDFRISHIPVILLTAKAAVEDKIEGLETGADDYIMKPFSSEELFIRIKNLIEQRKLLREKFSKEILIGTDNLEINSLDKEFIRNVNEVIEKNIQDFAFDTDKLADKVSVSRSQLNRKIKALTGLSPGEYIRNYKMKRAAQLILENNLSITQIAFEVGFSSPGQFTKAFKKHFGCLPSDFREHCKF